MNHRKRKLLIALTLAVACAGATMAADADKGASGPVRGACKDDVAALCKDVKRGGGAIAACLKEHKDRVSDACKSAIKARHGRRRGAESGGGAADGSQDQ